MALDKGIISLKSQYNDNFWDIIPIERMQIKEDKILPGETPKNADFDRAEEKAIKAIQKRSMLIGGSEKNPQIDEAYLLLGKSRYYDQRFVPAIEAFNYILYKYPNSDKIYEAKVWREKTNIRMENDALAVTNLTKLLREIKFKDQIFADANAILGQAYLNLEQKDSAISKLRIATKFTKENEEKARYRFILGQLYESMDMKDSAFVAYQDVINMKRKSPRQYVIQAHVKQAHQYDYKKGDSIAFLEKFKKLLEDRENRPYLDVLYHQKALFYDKQKKSKEAVVFYNKSLKNKTQDLYLVASNYRNLAEINFYKAKYQTAGNYYDSTLVALTVRTREYNAIKKKRENLVDVIKYEGIAQKNDSILNVLGLSNEDRISFYQDYIDKLKIEDEVKAKLEKERAENSGQDMMDRGGNQANSSGGMPQIPGGKRAPMSQAESVSSNNNSSGNSFAQSSFYFYNLGTVAQGKRDFKNKWGDRSLKDNWRLSSTKAKNSEDDAEDEEFKKDTKDGKKDEIKEDPRYSVAFYTEQLPKTITEKDSLFKERNFAYYQLGIIYKEKFKEYQLAADRLEILLRSNPEERLILPGMYNLFKVYEIIDKDKALAMKNKIISMYPESRYAQILSANGVDVASLEGSPEMVYKNLYKNFEGGKFREIKPLIEEAITVFTGEEIIPKLETLKAINNGKLSGLAEYKSGLNYVALNYPNSEEGKEAEFFLEARMPQLENLDFNQSVPLSWKVLYRANDLENKKTKTVIEKVTKFIKERGTNSMTSSIDLYTMDKNFLVIHGLKSEEYAKGIASILKEFKDYKIQEPAIIISNEDYKVVQIKKNLEDFLDPNYIPQEKKAFAPVTKKTEAKKGEIQLPSVEMKSVKNRAKAMEELIQQEKGKNPQNGNNPANNGTLMMPPSDDDKPNKP